MMRKVIVSLSLLFLLGGSFAAQAATPSSDDPYTEFVNNLLGYAKRFQGIRYRSGGTTPSGFDCSGFVRFVFAQFGMNIAHSSRDLSKMGYEVGKAEALAGDLIFFGNGSYVHHVGLVISAGSDGVRFIHSATSGGVMVSKLSEAYYSKKFVSIRRVIDNLKRFN